MTSVRTHPDSIAAGTGMDAVTLLVEDLDLQTRYYHDALALDVIDNPADRLVDTGRQEVVTLGRGRTPLIVLRHAPGLPRPAFGQAGLFHTAILFDDQAGLAATLASIRRRCSSSIAAWTPPHWTKSCGSTTASTSTAPSVLAARRAAKCKAVRASGLSSITTR